MTPEADTKVGNVFEWQGSPRQMERALSRWGCLCSLAVNATTDDYGPAGHHVRGCGQIGAARNPAVQWMSRPWTGTEGRITPGWVDRDAFPLIPDWNFEARE